uniref:glucan endo-1,3-beta-D-glucosidase n=1 Tax=Kalanchoe fedtschenkoi TaxID=63787 RepID=A0A7N1A7D5_KALFE
MAMKLKVAISASFLHVIFFLSGVQALGINYGQIGNDLPSPDKAVVLLKALRVSKTRIYDTNPQILSALANTGIEVIVTVENNMLATLMDPQQALEWVQTHISPYYPATKITGIAVGNEVFTDDDTSLSTQVVPAMVSIHQALVQLGMDSFVKVSSPSSLGVLASSYPPSSGSFTPQITPIMTQFLQFLMATGAPFWINAYPYFAYKDSPSKISLDYALMNSNPGYVDPYTNLRYDNMLYAQVDAVIFAMSKLGFGGLEVRVSETGWPSKGDSDEAGATVENAAMYNRNLFRRQLLGSEGTPLRPKYRLEVYLFALFNEDMKPGPTSERNYGIYRPDGTLCYNVGISTLSSSTDPATSSSSSSPASILLTSSAASLTKETKIGLQSALACCIFVHWLQLCMRRYM